MGVASPAVVKITRECKDSIVAPKVLYGVMQRLYIRASATLQMTPLAFVHRGVMELAHFKDEKHSARLLGEQPHDGLGLEGPAKAGPTGPRDAEASVPGVAPPPDGGRCRFPRVSPLREAGARYASRQRRMRSPSPAVAAAIRRQEVPSLTWTCLVSIARLHLHTAELSLDRSVELGCGQGKPLPLARKQHFPMQLHAVLGPDIGPSGLPSSTAICSLKRLGGKASTRLPRVPQAFRLCWVGRTSH